MKEHHSIATMFCLAFGVTGALVASHLIGSCVAQASSDLLIIQAKERNSLDEHGIFEKYDNSRNASERRERLDAFASYLKENPHFQAYIMSYAGRRTFRGEAKTRGQSAKRYLVKSKGVKPSRITVVDAGYRQHWVVELWYGVTGGSSPVPLPTVDRKHVIMRSGRPSSEN
jgi:hypothetical protein